MQRPWQKDAERWHASRRRKETPLLLQTMLTENNFWSVTQCDANGNETEKPMPLIATPSCDAIATAGKLMDAIESDVEKPTMSVTTPNGAKSLYVLDRGMSGRHKARSIFNCYAVLYQTIHCVRLFWHSQVSKAGFPRLGSITGWQCIHVWMIYLKYSVLKQNPEDSVCKIWTPPCVIFSTPLKMLNEIDIWYDH